MVSLFVPDGAWSIGAPVRQVVDDREFQDQFMRLPTVYSGWTGCRLAINSDRLWYLCE